VRGVGRDKRRVLSEDEELLPHSRQEPPMTDQAMSPLRRRSIFALGQAGRVRTSATFREILHAMWLLNAKFEQALSNSTRSRRGKGAITYCSQRGFGPLFQI